VVFDSRLFLTVVECNGLASDMYRMVLKHSEQATKVGIVYKRCLKS